MLAFNVYSLFIKFNASALVVGLFVTVDIEFNNPVTLFNPFAKEAVFFNIEFSNVNVVEEMVDMIAASRAYEANATVAENVKTMMQSAMNI